MLKLLLFGSLGMTEIIIIVLAIVLVFGAKRTPELMKGVGKGVRGFKEGIKGIEDEINSDVDSKTDKKIEDK